jgi:hypothetical protein
MGWLNWPLLSFPPINLYTIGMAGSHITDDEWLKQRKHNLSDDEIDEFENAVDVTKTSIGLEKSRQAALERVLRMRQRG